MKCIEISGRTVHPVTSQQGQKDYYNHLNYWNGCIHNRNIRILPTAEEAAEYMKLKEEKPSMFGNQSERKMYKMLQEYKNNYDWRPIISGEPHSRGLLSPTGERMLPDFFEDVFTQFDTLHDKLNHIPVSNGDGWALASIEPTCVLMTEFRYNAIISERWERKLFFVQDKNTMKWGALRSICQATNNRQNARIYLTTVESVMPCIADEIYEDEFMVDDPEEMPSLFFMLQAGNKVGILTDFGYSNIIYDTYETDDSKCSFRLIRNDRKRARRASWWNPESK